MTFEWNIILVGLFNALQQNKVKKKLLYNRFFFNKNCITIIQKKKSNCWKEVSSTHIVYVIMFVLKINKRGTWLLITKSTISFNCSFLSLRSMCITLFCVVSIVGYQNQYINYGFFLSISNQYLLNQNTKLKEAIFKVFLSLSKSKLKFRIFFSKSI